MHVTRESNLTQHTDAATQPQHKQPPRIKGQSYVLVPDMAAGCIPNTTPHMVSWICTCYTEPLVLVSGDVRLQLPNATVCSSAAGPQLYPCICNTSESCCSLLTVGIQIDLVWHSDMMKSSAGHFG